MATADVNPGSPYASFGATTGLYGAAASSVIGLVGTAMSINEQYVQMKALGEAAEREILAALTQASELERAAYQRSYAALFDIAIVNAVSDQAIRGFVAEGRYAEGKVMAETAASGLAFVGSPVLAAAAVSGEVARATAYEQFKTRTQVKAFQFEVVEELRRGQQARLAAGYTIEGVKSSATANAAALRAESLKDTLDGLKTTMGYAASPTMQDVLRTGYQGLFPRQTTALTPQRSPANL